MRESVFISFITDIWQLCRLNVALFSLPIMLPKKMHKSLIFIAFFSSIIIVACRKNEVENAPIAFQKPAGFPESSYDFTKNPLTTEGVALGKKLFYDPILSVDNTISCGSCHQQQSAFAHQSHDFSHGIKDKLGSRNAPSLQNLAWQTDFSWDGGVPHLDLFPFNPIESPVEMGEKVRNVLTKLESHKDYPNLFKKAFDTEGVTTERLMKALSQFQLKIVSADSRYDQFTNGNLAALNADEKEGLTLFTQHCGSCHTAPLFTDNAFRNNGLEAIGNDFGRSAITLDTLDSRKFKVPTLRNIEKTAPYMHDGRIRKLEDVVEHYRTGIRPSKTLDNRLKTPIIMSDSDKKNIVLFLKTLTDNTFLTRRDLSEF
jgi:cytochrome c peroxidase